MIVVMPNGSLPRPEDMPARPAPARPRRPSSGPRWRGCQDRFTDELLKDVVPVVEKTYPREDRPREPGAGRAVDGRRPDARGCSRRTRTSSLTWRSGAPASSAATPSEWEKRNEAFLAAADKVNDAVKLLEIVVGDKDFALAGSKALAEVLKKRGIKHEFHVTGGGIPGSTGGTT